MSEAESKRFVPRPTVWRMVVEAIEALGPETTNIALRDWILRRHPGTNKSTISCHIILCTVNHASRIYFSQNAKPRTANTKHDILFRPSRGQLERYDPDKHGRWAIRKDENGRLFVQQLNSEESDDAPPVERGMDDCGIGKTDVAQPDDSGSQFILESHLRDFVAQNLELVEPGLQLYTDPEADVIGVEYVTPIGRIDLLCVDRDGRCVIFEFKVSRGSDAVCGQLLRYMAWIKAHLADGSDVHGVIIANTITDRLRYAASMIPAVSLIEYELIFKLSPIESPSSV